MESQAHPQPARHTAPALRGAALALAAAVCVGCALQLCAAQQSHKPLSENDVIGLLTNDVPPARVEGFAKQFGTSFEVTSGVESRLREAGATDELIRTLKDLAPKPAAPRPTPHRAEPPPPAPLVLLIESQPGDAQVYIDDVPVGTTSSEGKLKLPNISRGTHRVRVSLAGFRDFEQSVQLTSGTFSVLAQLEKPEPPPAPAPAPSASTSAPASGSTPGTPGVLGIFLAKMPEGGRGMLVQALVPGSPAEEAGLRPGATVYSIAGRPLQSAEDLKQAMAGRPPGNEVVVTWASGGSERTASITLASNSIYANAPHFWVAHDHGPPAPNYCLGWMTVLDGMVVFVGQRGVGGAGIKHSFEFPFSQIAELKRNAFYMSAMGAFHIRTRDGKVANFIVLNAQGQHQPPTEFLQTVDQAMAKF
jgi:PEGA domain/PDZ domain